jgi:hypothetical protein
MQLLKLVRLLMLERVSEATTRFVNDGTRLNNNASICNRYKSYGAYKNKLDRFVMAIRRKRKRSINSCSGATRVNQDPKHIFIDHVLLMGVTIPTVVQKR